MCAAFGKTSCWQGVALIIMSHIGGKKIHRDLAENGPSECQLDALTTELESLSQFLYYAVKCTACCEWESPVDGVVGLDHEQICSLSTTGSISYIPTHHDSRP